MNSVILLFCIGAVLSTSIAYGLFVPSIEGRIINGQLAAANQFPWHASVQGVLANGQPTLCGGALISNAFVLTAAHCVLK